MDDPKSPRRNRWVCPNDRGLALLAKVGAGWSMKSHDLQIYKKTPVTLDESEKQVIMDVIQRADALESLEQQRVGRLIDRLDNMKRNTMGTRNNQCILCGAQCIRFGLLSPSSMICHDCSKAVCHKCGIETVSESGLRKDLIWRCKICAETREMWKKSNAWFFKAIPKHVLPIKKLQKEGGCSDVGKRLANQKATWSHPPHMKPPKPLDDSSSDDEIQSQIYISRSMKLTEPSTSSSLSASSSSRSWYPMNGNRSPGVGADSTAKELAIADKPDVPKAQKSKKLAHQRDTSEGSESSGSATGSNLYPMKHNAEPSTSRSNNCNVANEDNASACSSSASYYSRQNSQGSLQSRTDWWPEPDHYSLSGSSTYGHRARVSHNLEQYENGTQAHATEGGANGVVEFNMIYCSESSTIHITVLLAKNLRPTDIKGLADPFCKLLLMPVWNKCHRLRTRTVHKTLNPVFNETLTFYGVTVHDLSFRCLHIVLLDDDKYGNDFLGETSYCLKRLPQNEKAVLNLVLENYQSTEKDAVFGEKEWVNGQILVSLCYSIQRQALIVGIIQCNNLLPMDSNGFSDPFVKLYLEPEYAHKKSKTSVKWKNLNPVYNEEFSFETKLTDLSHQTLILSVWDKDIARSNDYLGCLELGCKSKGERLRHWLDVIKLPDNKHVSWHYLSPDPPPPKDH